MKQLKTSINQTNVMKMSNKIDINEPPDFVEKKNWERNQNE